MLCDLKDLSKRFPVLTVKQNVEPQKPKLEMNRNRKTETLIIER